MIDEELNAIRAGPACKGDLLFEETRIICPACRKAYPIRDGIPVMPIAPRRGCTWAPPLQQAHLDLAAEFIGTSR